MSKPIIILADNDESYIATLEYKLLELLGNRVELEIITETAFFEYYFSTPKTAEIVAVSEGMYSDSLARHNINHLFILTNNISESSTRDLSLDYVYKYGGIKELFNELLFKSKDIIFADEKENKVTKVLAFYSAIGGTGKTCLSMGFSACLARKHQKVLYINTESIQSFAYLLKQKMPMPSDGYRALKNSREYTYNNIKQYIRTEEFSYIPPFSGTLDAINLDFSFYTDLILSVKDSKEYDFIIVDIEAGYNSERNAILQLADKAIIVLLQDKLSQYKTEYLFQNIDFSEQDKYVFVCNKYSDDKENAYIAKEGTHKIKVHEYIGCLSNEKRDIEEISSLKGIEKLVYLFV